MKFLSLILVSILFSVILIGPFSIAQSPSPSPAVAASPAPDPLIVDPNVAAIDKAVPAQDANSLLAQVFALLSAGKIGAAISAMVLLLVYLFRVNFVDKGKIGSGALPWLAVVLGALMAIASNVLLGASPLAAAEALLFSGPMASAIWSSVFKLAVKKVI